ncbi:MAG TPA: DUF2461 domain-containing protein, partial [Actinomycetales bacterium]
QQHRATYDERVAEPMAALADALEDEFGEPKVFRPYRDVRFSKDKSPYQLHASMAAPGRHDGGTLYLQVGLEGLLVAGGWWQPQTQALTRFRHAVDDPKVARSFDRQRARLETEGLALDADPLKTAPRGWDRDHPRLDLLRMRNLAFTSTTPPGPDVGSAQCLDLVVGAFRHLERWNGWLAEHVGARD